MLENAAGARASRELILELLNIKSTRKEPTVILTMVLKANIELL